MQTENPLYLSAAILTAAILIAAPRVGAEHFLARLGRAGSGVEGAVAVYERVLKLLEGGRPGAPF
ncbi:hypothetical protein CO641_02470 [Lysobacteraceae bacterium NML91-0213]|nr:hypothetical protein CO641_02470 [Xanthomonadaceae bacterium NML91-0213]